MNKEFLIIPGYPHYGINKLGIIKRFAYCKAIYRQNSLIRKYIYSEIILNPYYIKQYKVVSLINYQGLISCERVSKLIVNTFYGKNKDIIVAVKRPKDTKEINVNINTIQMYCNSKEKYFKYKDNPLIKPIEELYK